MCAICPADAAISSELALISAVMFAVSPRRLVERGGESRSSTIIAPTARARRPISSSPPISLTCFERSPAATASAAIASFRRRTGDAALDEPTRQNEQAEDQREHRRDAAEQ